MDRILRHPAFATIITVLIIVAGLWGSIFALEIRRAFHFYWGRGPISWEASVFWVLVLISASTFFFRERSIASEQERLRKLAEERTGKLEELQRLSLARADEFERLIRTLPPENFLEVFATFFGAADHVMDVVFADTAKIRETPDLIEGSVREILRSIAALARRFDGDHPLVKHAANVMLFRASSDMSPSEMAEVRPHLLFCDETVSVEQLKGVLVLDVALSTTATDSEIGPDPEVQPIALPIPKTAMSGVRYKVFPGAPLAFTEREPSHYTDTAGLPRWCEVYGDFTRQIITSMAEFFVKSPVRSFLSVPLFVLTDQGFDEDTVDPIGVLNIHSSQTGLLKGGGEPLTHFTSIIRPFQIFLVQLLILLHPEYAAVKSLTEVEESGKSDS